MAPPLRDAALLQDEDEIGLHDGGETMGDHEARPPRQGGRDGVLDEALGLGVDRACGLIEDEEGRIGQEGPRQGDELLLARREEDAALPPPGPRSRPLCPAAPRRRR